MNLLEKLNYLMSQKDINKNVLAKESGIPYTTLDGLYKKGYKNTKLSTIRKLSEFFDVTIDYLIDDNINDPEYGKPEKFTINKEEMHIVEKLRRLDERGKESVLNTLGYEYSRPLEPSAQIPSIPYRANVITLPRLDQAAGMGEGQYNGEGEILTTPIEYPADRIPDGTDFTVPVVGDSMEPLYYDGDTLFVEQTDILNNGEVGLFNLNGESMVKRCEEEGLVSENKEFPLIEVREGDSLHVIGRVLGKV